jgi:hypothetical protein
MSSIQIPNLPVATGLNGTEQFEGVQSGTSVQITTNQIASYINSAYPAPGIATITGTAPINASTVGNAVTISLNSQGVTNSFLAPMAAGTVKANVTVGSASPTDATVSQVLDVIGSTKGNLLYRDTSSWAALTGGTNGQVLTAQGTTAVPIWTTLSVPSGNIQPTGVTAGTYGSASTVPQFTVLASGQISNATNVPITIPYTSVTGLGSMATQNASAVAITGGTIDGTTIGGTTPAAASFTSLTATGPTNVATIASGVWNGTAIGVSYGGTGATTAAGARSNLGAAASGANSDITSLSGLTTPLSEPQGGTGFSSYTTGDLLYADASDSLARLNDVATGNALISGGVGVAPSYGKIGLTTHVSGTLPVANGGTGATTLTGYVYGNGTGAFTAATTIPNAGLTNSSVTIGSTSISLGGTATTLAGLTTVTLTQDPTAALQASTKQYVDNQVATVSNQTFHTASGYGTTANLTATYSNGTGGVGATLTNSGALAALTIDGYTFTATDVTNATRVLVKDQTTGAQNGIYVVTNQGSGSVAWVLTRASDFNTVGTGPNYIETGASTFVTGGSTNASTGWVMTTTGTITVGSTSLTWTQTSSSSSVTVTSPLTKVGSVISLGTVPTTLGGTGLTTLTQYNVMLGNGTGNVAFAAPGTTGYPLLSTGASSNPAFGQLSLTAGVTGTLPVANGGTGTATAFTTGSVVFAGASGVYSQNNTKLFWDNTNNRLGVNTGAPNAQLTILSNSQTVSPPSSGSLPAGTDIYIMGANGANTRITQDAYGTGSYAVFTARSARGTAASPTASQADDTLAQFTARGYATTGFSNSSVAYIGMYAAENFTDTAQGTYLTLETTSIGSATLVEKFRVGPSGQWGIFGASSPDYGTSGYVFTSGGASAKPTWSQVSASSLTGVLPVANGGTNISSYTIGDLIYASGTTTLSKLADVATGNALISGGVGAAPSWGKIGLTTHVSGTLPIANGGTNLTSTPTNGQLLIGNGTGYSLGTLTAGSSNFVVTNGSGSITLDINASPTLTGLTVNGPAVISTSSSSDALRITQTGAGNAILVEDSANPDSTPFVVNASGQVLVGATTAPFGSTIIGLFQSAADSAPPYQDFFKNRAGATTVSGDGTGQMRFWAYDGANYLNSSYIATNTDGTVASTDAPGRIVFGTRPAGAGGVAVERMRVNSAGGVSIGLSGAAAGTTLRLSKDITGATTSSGALINGVVQSDVTSEARLFATSASTAAAAFTLGGLTHFYAAQSTIGATSTVTNQYGFLANSNLTGATNNYGFYGNLASASSVWNFFANGTANNAFNGNSRFGGITAPSYAVDVTGSVNASTSVISPLHIGGTAVSSTLTLQSTSGAGTSDAIIFQTGSQTERMRIDTSGNVGIGTASPAAKLHVSSSTAGDGIRVSGNNFAGTNYYGTSVNTTGVFTGLDSGGGFVVNVRDSGYQAFSTNNTERMRIDSSGNVGIGTTTIPYKLVVSGTTGTGIAGFNGNNNGSLPGTNGDASLCIGANYSGGSGEVDYFHNNSTFSGSNGGHRFIQRTGASTAADLLWVQQDLSRFYTGGSERMRIISTGDVYIGTTSQLGNGGQVQIAGYNAVGGTGYFGFMTVKNTYGSATNPNKYFRMNSTGNFEIVNNAYNAVILALTDAGDFTVTGSVSDSIGNVRTVPLNSQTTGYTLVATDSGKCISITTGGVTIPSGIFSAGQTITIFNNSASSQTITQGASVTMYLVGTATTGNRTLAQRGLCTVFCVASNTFVITGGGLT